jgi:hypothetical protein
VLGDQPLEAGEHLVVAAERQQRVVAEFHGSEPALFEFAPGCLGRSFAGEVGERGSAPERER